MRMSSTKSRHGGDIYGFSDEERDKFLDFSININPLGLSPKGKAALTAGWEKETLRYPDVVTMSMKLISWLEMAPLS